jgi:hypothetical protein
VRVKIQVKILWIMATSTARKTTAEPGLRHEAGKLFGGLAWCGKAFPMFVAEKPSWCLVSVGTRGDLIGKQSFIFN